MDMSSSVRIEASREDIYAALNDPQILEQCIPGCERMTKVSDTEFRAAVTAKVGPVKAGFVGDVTLSDIDPPNGYTITGQGKGGPAGFAKMSAQVRLEPDGAGTRLYYDAHVDIGGKLAQVGSRLINSTAKKFTGDFFSKFAQVVVGD
jgi:carbon monoxide dehydrogenase subunit G